MYFLFIFNVFKIKIIQFNSILLLRWRQWLGGDILASEVALDFFVVRLLTDRVIKIPS